MEKELQTSIVHYQQFGEGQRFANKARRTLSEGIVPAFHMSRFPGLLPNIGMLLWCESPSDRRLKNP